MGGLSIDACYSLLASWVSYDYDLARSYALDRWQGTPEALLAWLGEYRQGKTGSREVSILTIVDRINLEALPLSGRYPRRVRLVMLNTGQLALLVAEHIGAWGFNPVWAGLFDAGGQLVSRVRFWEELEQRRLFPHLPEQAEAVLYLNGLFAAIKWLDGEPGCLADRIQPVPQEYHRALFYPAVQEVVKDWRGSLLLYIQDGVVYQRWIGDTHADTDQKHLA